MLQGPIGKEVQRRLLIFCEQLDCEIVEMNVQVDHVQLLVKAPPKLSISKLMGVLKVAGVHWRGTVKHSPVGTFPAIRRTSSTDLVQRV